ncbi:MAG TPA: hypothetical protein VMH02_01590 [Verrucomicrobiae bacterium]|nr:hypothetical protein [Verrucomicrobiae bacterium]
MSDPRPIYTVDEFERESRHIERAIWESLCIEPGAKILFCGYGPDGEQVRRAVDTGAIVTVIEHRDAAILRFANIGAKLLRGSTSVIPARDNSFDLAISFHYLHEIDPFFHAQVLFELGRVAGRVAVVEPAPPADALGKRIALLYSQAKRELGQFEYYQPMEYWKKLLQSVKADVAQHVFAFGKVPPSEYLRDTIELLIHTIEVEQAPKGYIDELRQIARRSASQLLPPPRYVLVGAAAGALPKPQFSGPEEALPPAQPVAAPQPVARPEPVRPAASAPRAVTPDAGYEFPPVDPIRAAPAPAPVPGPAPSVPAAPPAPADAAPPAAEPPAEAEPPREPVISKPRAFRPPRKKTSFSATPAPPGAPPPAAEALFGSPFAMPAPEPFGAAPAGIQPSAAWQWEPPEGGGDEAETPFGPPPKP